MNIVILDPHPIMADALAQVIRRIVPTAKVNITTTRAQLEHQLCQVEKPTLLVVEPYTEGLGRDVGLLTFLEGYAAPFVVFSSDPIGLPEPHAAPFACFISKQSSVKALTAELSKILVPASDDTPSTVLKPLKLTKRMRQFLLYLDKGKSNREIAADFAISEHTVKVHMWRLYKRIGVNSRTAALHYARTNGWL